MSLADMGLKLRLKEEQLELLKEEEEKKKCSGWVDEKTVRSCMQCDTEFTNLVRKVPPPCILAYFY